MARPTVGPLRNRAGRGSPLSCVRPVRKPRVETFLVSITTVAAAEMGDRTQLLSLVLVARYGQPWPILAGVFLATLASHSAAGLIGASFGSFLTPTIVDAAVGVGMIGMGLWTLCPDTLEDGAELRRTNAFTATLVAFFVAEIGDKTQIAAIALAAAYANLPVVIAGTTCGLMAAVIPVVFLGKAFADRLPIKTIHVGAVIGFTILGAVFLARAFMSQG